LNFNMLIKEIDHFIWGIPLISLLLFCGIWFTIKLRFIQVSCFFKAFRFLFFDKEKGRGDISSYAALCTALAATIGTGSIVGVATAIKAGGPGSIFWMCFAAFFGMGIKYAESVLAVKFRRLNKKGEIIGGPFYYIEKGVGKNNKWIAKAFALFGIISALFGIGTMVQSNSITSAAVSLGSTFSVNKNAVLIITSIVVTILSGLVIIGGIKRIAGVSEVIIPFMAILYFICCLIIIILNIEKLPNVIISIFKGAFSYTSAIGGFCGAGFIAALRMGIARGIFSNEAGLGSEPIAAATAKTNFPAKQGLVSMIGTFIDTIVICTITGITILITGAWKSDFNGVEMTNLAFSNSYGNYSIIGNFIVGVGLILFAFSSIIGWCYYGEQCSKYLFGEYAVKYYRFTYIIMILLGCYINIDTVWVIADICNGFMAIPNLFGVLYLSNTVINETVVFFAYQKANGILKL
jgi:AGCS family alanine or glycine:cation symporter